MRYLAGWWVLVCALVMGLAGHGLAQSVFDANGGSGGGWHTAANWNPDVVPNISSNCYLDGKSDAANYVTISSDAEAALLYMAASGDTDYLDIQANLTVAGSYRLAHKGLGVVNHSTGKFTCETFNLAGSTTSAGRGQYTMSGDATIHVTGNFVSSGGTSNTLTQTSAGSTVIVEGNITGGNTSCGERWQYQLYDGSLSVTGTVTRKYGAYLFDQQGGTAWVGVDLSLGTGYRSAGAHGDPMEWMIAGDSSLDVVGNATLGWVGDGGTHVTGPSGRFTLNGARGSGTDVAIGGNWRQVGTNTPNTASDSWGCIKAVIDNTAAVTKSSMRKVHVTGNVTFDDGSYVQPEFDPGTLPVSGTWTIMTWGGSKTDNGLVLEPSVDPNWTFEVGDSSLTITYSSPIPPGTVITVN